MGDARHPQPSVGLHAALSKEQSRGSAGRPGAPLAREGLRIVTVRCQKKCFAVPAQVLFAMAIQPGAIVGLHSKPDALYQVVTLEEYSDSAWVRRWPLSRHRLPTFSVPHSDITTVKQEAYR